MTRTVATGQFVLPMSADRAIGRFTPEGEREWVPGWEPEYPAGGPSEAPGTVFTTAMDATRTIWVVQAIDRTRCAASYVRVTPGRHAGTVQVRCVDSDAGCLVSVRYDMTLLPGADPTALDGYRDDAFAEMMAEWARAAGR